MDKDKQIEEIYRILLNGCNGIDCNECEGFKKKDGCLHYHNAHSIYNAGYRKASKVAREMFEEIEKMLLDNHIESFKNLNDEWVHRFKESLMKMLAELKKKYTEDGK